jgi:CrcB protein
MSGLVPLALVAMGGALGGVLRLWVTALVDRTAGGALPWGTLAVNVTGAAAIGLAAALLLTEGIGRDLSLWLGLAVGVLGSYTTVSSFSLQVLLLVREGRAALAATYLAASLALCLAAALGTHMAFAP